VPKATCKRATASASSGIATGVASAIYKSRYCRDISTEAIVAARASRDLSDGMPLLRVSGVDAMPILK
jgi:hypothetical protein